MTIDRLGSHTGPRAALLVQQGHTDAAGELVLRGPPATKLGLRVRGPDHAPLIENDVTLAAGAPPLVITIPVGATIRGTMSPVAALRQLQRSGLFLIGRRDGKVAVHRPHAAGEPFLPPSQVFPIEADGTFELKEVPPGTWELHLSFPGEVGGGSESIATVPDLVPGETRRIDVDVAHLLPSGITGVVLFDGVPLANADFHLLGRRAGGPDDAKAIVVVNPGRKLDAGGRFTIRARPATYRLLVSLPPQAHGARQATGGARVPAAETLVVEPGRDTHQVFHVRLGGLRLRLRSIDGRALSGVPLHLASPDGSWSSQAMPTDEQGATHLGNVPFGTVVLTAWPKLLADHKVRNAFLTRTRDPEARQAAMVSLGRAEVGAGEGPVEVELVMPASAGY
jgi:hypothetical protein